MALAIAGLILGVVIPSAWNFYESSQYRKAVRDLSVAAAAARYRAITSGIPQDVVLQPSERRYLLRRSGEGIREGAYQRLPAAVTVSAITAAEVNPRSGLAGIRFYPDGSSSGGSISVRRGSEAGDGGVRLRVDWLLGSVSQEPL